MEQEQKQWKETINYIKSNHDDGRVSYTGQSVNYRVVCSSWKSVEDLQQKMSAMIHMWLEHGKETLEHGLEMNELTEEEWDAKDDNIDYWEVEHIKRILKRPSIQDKWKKVITEVVIKEIEWLSEAGMIEITGDIADVVAYGTFTKATTEGIIQAIMNMENE